jgi:hypothetical protein
LLLVVRFALGFESVGHRFGGLAQRARVSVSRIGLMQAAALGAVAVGALSWWHYDLIDAIYNVAGGVIDEPTLAMLSPDNQPYHLAYRTHFTLLVIALVATVFLVKARSRTSTLAMILVILVATILMELPWQILWQARFPRVRYGAEVCYDVGAMKDEVLLFCPLSAPSRTRVVARGDERLIPTGVIESVFSPPPK